MKILVPIKRVVDYNAKIRINAESSDVDLTNTKMAMNPFCEIALEEAVRFKEANIASEVIAVSIGPKEANEQLRTAIALGADRGLRVECEKAPESLHVAKLLAKIADLEKPDLILLGKQSIDSDNNQTGQMLAALLDMPQGTFASDISIDSNQACITREVDGGLEKISLALPAIITADLRLNQPRYVSLPNIMKAKRASLEVKTIEELGISFTENTRTLKVEAPPKRKEGIKVDSIHDLLDVLRNKEKLI